MKNCRLIIFMLFLICFSGQIKSNAVQIAYCVDCSGNLRIFVEHTLGNANTNNANLTIQLNIGGIISAQTNTLAFSITGVPFGALPGCSSTITSLGACPGQANTFNDWVIFNYSALPSGVPISFTINNGSNPFTQDGCSMYPLTANFTIPVALGGTLTTFCQGQLGPAINAPVGINWINTNPSIGLPANGTGFIPPFTATGSGTAIISYPTNCGVHVNTLIVVPTLVTSFNNSSPAGGVCSGTAINFTDTSPIASTWNWNFGDGITSNSQNPNHVYANTGTYTVTETITNVGFCSGTSTQVVTVNPYPSLAFALTSVCSGINVPVINTSTISNGNINYSWLITGGTPNNSNVANPVFSYASSGNYTVNLTGTSTAGCVSNLSNTVAITPAPIANFIVNNTACSTATVSVISTSSLNGGAAITNYQYDWNDLSPNALTNPATHTYASSGSKSITLLITSASGCTSSATQNFTVTQSPIVNYTFTPLCMGSAINFTNSSSTPAGANSYTWNYGDASGSNANNPSHTYSNSGTYSVTLIATNTDLCTDSIKKVVNVYGTANVDFLASDVCFNTPTNFTNITTTTLNANTGAIASYSWNFGVTAGSSSTTNPIYTYTNPANATANTTYSVTLFATTIDGCKDSITKVVTVYSLPTPTFLADSVCNGSSTTLTDVGNNNGNPYFLFNWSCNSLTTPTITNVFPTSGNNSVTYTVITSPNAGVLQCKSVFTKNVWVRYEPYADITFTNQCASSITPIGLSGVTSTVAVGTITNYAWDYGNATSSLVNPTPSTSVSYSLSGTYIPTLTVTSSEGCTNTAVKTVTVFGRADVDFLASDVCFGTPTSFTNITTTTVNVNTGAVASYSWNFGATAGSSSNTNPIYTYTNPANRTANTTYSVTLFATTIDGCKDSITKVVTVYSLPTPTFVADSVCNGSSTTLTDVGNNNGNPYFLFNWSCNSLTTPTITNVFPTSGNNSVTYTVITSPNAGVLQCKSVFTKNVWVRYGPYADITFTNQCIGSAPIGLSGVTSTATIGATITNYAWDFGNATSSLVNPTPSTLVSYAISGTYITSLTVTSSDGCINTAVKTVTAFGRADVDFLASDVCFGTPTNFTNITTTTVNANTGAVTSYSWNFGATAGSSSNTNPIYTYTNPANATANTTYSVTLFATTIDGCKDSTTKVVTVYSLPTPTFVADSVCDGSSTTLADVSNNNGNPYFLFNWSCNSLTTPTITNVFPTAGNNSVTYTVITSPNAGVLQCSSVFTKNVWVRYGPFADITFTNQCASSTTPIELSGVNSTAAIGTTLTNYAWDFGNATSSLVNPTPSTLVSYAIFGTYITSLTVTSSDGCINTAVKTVTAFGRADVDFLAPDVCFGTPTNFTNLTSTTVNANTGALASYSWNFGATVGSSSATSPIYTYTNPANATANISYSVTLFATTSDGCIDSITKVVTVYSLPTPNFVADSVCKGNQTTFTNIGNSNGNPFSLFRWDFNNDSIVDLINPSPTTQTVFPNYGNYVVSYTVATTPNGTSLSCSTKITKNVWVHPLPVSLMTHVNKCVNAQPVTLDGSGSTVVIGSIANYAWNYGNNTTSLINPNSASSHSYNIAGNYLVTLTVTTNAGCKSVTTNTIEVWEKPNAHFSYSKVCLAKKTTLTAYQEPISGLITDYSWDFNNNTSDAEANGVVVSRTFTVAGAQTVSMLLTSDKGCKNVIPGNIYVNYLPKPNFYATKRAGCTDLCTSIIDSSATLTGPAKNASWEWSFGNDKNVIRSTPNNSTSICYSNTSNLTVKNYTLRLVLRSDSGCVDSIIKYNYIAVYPKPKADFGWIGNDGTIFTPEVKFTNTSKGYTNFQWSFGDSFAIDSVNTNPTHNYVTDADISYNVFLAVRNQYGCKDTLFHSVEVGPNFTFYIPEAFSPNDDGLNEVFTGKGIGIKTFKMYVFDRWGDVICYTEDITKGWDGSIKGNKVDTKADIYQWRVSITDIMNKKHEYIGKVSLIK